MLAIIEHPECALHDMGIGHPEQPARYHTISTALKAYPFATKPLFLEAPLATRDELTLAHDPDYVDSIFKLSPQSGMMMIDADTSMNPHTLQAALRAAGAARFAVDQVMSGKAQAVFCNVRPPGHHAEYDKAMGFCFFNNIAIAVRYALQKYGLKRIAIVDFDVHHGNGTQNILQDETRVLFCSSFQHPYYPGYDAENDNTHILNVPLVAGTSGHDFREKVSAAWFKPLMDFQPELICFSAGFDAHRDDPLAQIRLTKEDYVWLTEKVKEIAKSSAQGRMISMLEGGYHLPALAECVPAHVNAML